MSAAQQAAIEEVELKYKREFQEQIRTFHDTKDSFNIAGYIIDKILMRVAAVKLIDDIEQDTENYAIKKTISTVYTLMNRDLSLQDPAEKDGIFEGKIRDRDYMSIQNSSLFMSENSDDGEEDK